MSPCLPFFALFFLINTGCGKTKKAVPDTSSGDTARYVPRTPPIAVDPDSPVVAKFTVAGDKASLDIVEARIKRAGMRHVHSEDIPTGRRFQIRGIEPHMAEALPTLLIPGNMEAAPLIANLAFDKVAVELRGSTGPIGGQIETWVGPSGKHKSGTVLWAKERGALEQYVRDRPELQELGAGLQIMFEREQGFDGLRWLARVVDRNRLGVTLILTHILPRSVVAQR